MTPPKARTIPLAALYSRTIHDEFGETVQYLEPRPSGNWLGWEVYEDGTESDKQVVSILVLPIGYVAVRDDA